MEKGKEKEPHKNEVLTKKDFYLGLALATGAITCELMQIFNQGNIYLFNVAWFGSIFTSIALFLLSW